MELGSAKGKVEADYSLFETCCGGTQRKVWLGQVAIFNLVDKKTGIEVEWKGIDSLASARPESIFKIALSKKDKKVDISRHGK